MPTPPPHPPAASDPLLGQVLDGRYRVEAFIARGGMATIYRGADLRLDRTVAIKVMHPAFASDPGFVDRFEREARAAARLNSPYAVAVHDQGNDAGQTYLVMEYVPGHTVRDVLRTHGALPPAQALAILDPVLEALAAAHRAGYIHRDIKPENVLISDDGRVKVTDFGLARAIEGADSGRTHGLLLGTVAYLSPEQVEHDRTDARSDVYSAGILLFELVTGQVPYSAAAPMQVAYKHVHEDVPAPSTVRADLPPEIDALVGRAARRAPADRFPDAAAFLAEVRSLRAALPPASPWAPVPTDTLVVATGRAGGEGRRADPPADPPADRDRGDAEELAPPEWVGQPATGGAADAMPAHAAAAVGAGGAVAIAADPDADDAPVGRLTEVTHQTSPDTPARARRGRKALWLGAVAVLSVTGLLVLLFGPLQQVSVPDVLGKTELEASAILATANLTLAAETTDYSEDYPKGQIIATEPGPNSSVRTGSTVSAVVSKGPERYDVPKLAGLTEEDADLALAATSLELGEVTKAYDESVKKGRIVASSPKAGTSVKPGTKVDITLSRGPKPIPVPAVAGVDADEATKTLEDLGLTVERSEEYSGSVPRGEVISTTPKADATLYKGDTVTIVVSKGPPLVTVPNVVGKGESAARAELEKAGLKVTVRKPFGTAIFGVRSQSPGGGTQAPRGSTVTITIV